MPPVERLDWINIERDYLCGYWQTSSDGTKQLVYQTIDELAQKYGCSRNAIARRCSKEKWLNRRELFKEKLQCQTISEGENFNLSDSARYDSENLIRLEKIGKLIDNWLENKLKLDKEGNQISINPKDLILIVDVIAKKHQLVRKIFGEPFLSKKSQATQIEKLPINQKEVNLTEPETLKNLAQIFTARAEKLRLLRKQDF